MGPDRQLWEHAEPEPPTSDHSRMQRNEHQRQIVASSVGEEPDGWWDVVPRALVH
jgi:hypothetical protein